MKACAHCSSLSYPPNADGTPYITYGQCGRDLSKPDTTRTLSQNRALFLWFEQIAQICQNQGVTFQMVLSHVAELAVTKENNHMLAKRLSSALWGIESTTKLEKKHIDVLVDHFTALYAKNEVEVPPFPSSDTMDFYDHADERESADRC